ncbi:MAG: ATP-binding cassette domain-containing protein, partial [Chitinophagaceae bacterium]
TILEEMKGAGSNKTELELRTLLGCFLFSGDDTDKKIKILSGGEKARVALAKTIVSKANFLLLDEPTNHLDIHSTELLVDALNRYEGSYILVSHDRYFISKTANKIWEIVEHQVKEFKGGYEEWVQWKDRMAEANAKSEVGSMKTEVRSKKLEERRVSLPINKEVQKDLQKQQKLFKSLEEEIAKYNEDKKIIETDLTLSEIYTDKKKFTETEKKYKDIQEKIDQLNKSYEEIFEKIIELEGKQNA